MIDYVIIRNAKREKIGIVDIFTSLIWHSEYYNTGDFELHAPLTTTTAELLKAGNYVTRPNDDNIGIIESVRLSYSQQQGQMITAGGRFAKSILDRRLIYRLDGTVNRPTVLSGNVENAARALVNRNIINATDTARNIDFIKLGAVAGITHIIVDEDGNATSKQTSYENLLEYSDALLQEYKCGAKMVLNSDLTLAYAVYEGKDRSHGNADGNVAVVFSQTFDNLLTSEYVYNESTDKTTALIGGAGEDLDRFYNLFAGGYSGMRRKEVFVDARSINKKYTEENDTTKTEKEYTDAEYRGLLNAQARQELEPLKVLQEFNGTVDTTHSQYHYQKDFFLGDIVTVRDDFADMALNTRIIGVTEIQDGNGYSINITFEND